MLTRIISGLVLLPLLFFVIIKGGISIYLGALICSLIGLYEFFKVFESSGYKPLKSTIYAATVIMYTAMTYSGILYSHIVISIIYIIFAVGAVYIMNRKVRVEDLMISIMGYIYIPVFLSHINLMSMQQTIYIWLVFIFAWGSDTCAYFSGMFFGKHKLIPEISPKKTVEGSIGGIAGTVVMTLVFAKYFQEPNLMYFIPLAMIGSTVSQIGDLFASAIKREFGIKDYGNLIPGHGGILDRFDSILFTAPLTYYGITFINYIQNL
ncbi:phosphatidate cytidylyltransferase [Proteocatella sphenisci]|uniref:phosphatidate cytidylyltransferase n=1 Tax=Proteocatella sphenisci TaxID=181070 RepID=UPI00048B5B2B|nr:phosphatidate cytidylyltransferase [Proteocatella sphenisci]